MAKKITSIAFGLLAMICCLFGFTACGDPYKDLKVSVSSENIVEGKDYILLDCSSTTKNTATITANVSGLSDKMIKGVVWNSSDNNKVSVVSSYISDGICYGVIEGTGATLDDNCVTITAYSKENSVKCASVKVRCIMSPTSATLVSNSNLLGIPLDEDYVLEPTDFLYFGANSYTIPKYTFEIDTDNNGEIETYYTGDKIKIAKTAGLNNVNIKMYPTDDIENKDSLTKTLNVFTFTPIDLNNVRFDLKDGTGLYNNEGETNWWETKCAELVLNAQGKSADINPNSLSYNITNTDTVLGLQISDITCDAIRTGLGINVANDIGRQNASTINLVGYDEGEYIVNIKLVVTTQVGTEYLPILNCQSKTLPLKVKVVKYPQNIVVNNISGSSDIDLNIYDRYVETSGQKLCIELAEYTDAYKQFRIKVTDDSNIFDKLVIYRGNNKNPETYSNKNALESVIFESGQVFYIKNKNLEDPGTITFTIEGVTSNTMVKTLSRTINLNLQYGITAIDLANKATTLNENGTGSLLLNCHSDDTSVTKRDITLTATPATASLDTIVVVDNYDTSVIKVEPKTTGTYTITATGLGTTTIMFREYNSGVTYAVPVEVFDTLTGFNFGVIGQTDKIGKVEPSSTNVSSITVMNNSTISLQNVLTPTTAVATIEYKNKNEVNTYASLYARSNNKTTTYVETYAEGSSVWSIIVKTNTIDANGQLVTTYIYDDIDGHRYDLTINVYKPITHITTNIEEYTFYYYKENTSNIYIKDQMKKELTVSVWPSEVAGKASNAKWSIAGIGSYKAPYLEQNGIEIVCNDKGDSPTLTGDRVTVGIKKLDKDVIGAKFYISVTVTEYNHTFTKTILFYVERGQAIQHILVNTDEQVGSNVKVVNGGEFTGNVTTQISCNTTLNFNWNTKDTAKFALDISVLPQNATISEYGYLLFDLNSRKKILPRQNVGGDTYYSNTTSCKLYEIENDVIKFREGASFNKGDSGYAVLVIVPLDTLQNHIQDIVNYPNTGFTNSYTILLYTADGSKENPYRLYDAVDMCAIDTNQAYHYELMNNINMSGVNIFGNPEEPLSFNVRDFNGVLTSYDKNNFTLYNISVDKELNISNNDALYYGLFNQISGTITNVNFKFNSVSYTISTNTGGIYLGILAGAVVSGGKLQNINITVNNLYLEDTGTSDLTFGAIGIVQTGGMVNGISVNIINTTEDNNTGIKAKNKFYFGGVAGDNHGTIINANSIVNFNISTQSNAYIGGVVGQNNGVILGANVSGTIKTNDSTNNNIGGIIGLNKAYLNTNINIPSDDNTLDADITKKYTKEWLINIDQSDSNINIGQLYLVTQDSLSGVYCWDGTKYFMPMSQSTVVITANGNVGGIVGALGYTDSKGSTGGIVANSYYLILNLSNEANGSIGISGTGNLGGIVGCIDSGTTTATINFSYTKSYTTTYPNIITTNTSKVGGIVGYINGQTNINQCYCEANIKTSTLDSFAGLIAGKIDNTTTMNNCYTIGWIEGVYNDNDTNSNEEDDTMTTAGTVFGTNIEDSTSASITLNQVYSTAEVRLYQTINDVKTLKRTHCSSYINEANTNIIGNNTNLGSSNGTSYDDWTAYISANYWVSDTDNLNYGLPYLRIDVDNVMLLQVPTEITLNAEAEGQAIYSSVYDKDDDDKATNINHVIRSSGKKVTIIKDSHSTNTYDLFDTDGLFNLSTNPNIDWSKLFISVECSNNNIATITKTSNNYTITANYAGTVIISVYSTQNRNVFDRVQICIIDAFDKFGIVNKNNEALTDVIGVQKDSAIRNNITFKTGESAVTNVSGGVKIVIAESDKDKIKINGLDWETDGESGYYYVTLQSPTYYTISGLKKADNIQLYFIPYIISYFYDGDTLTSEITYLLEGEYTSINTCPVAVKESVVVYLGATNLTVDSGSMEIYPSDSFDINATLYTDNITGTGEPIVYEAKDDMIELLVTNSDGKTVASYKRQEADGEFYKPFGISDNTIFNISLSTFADNDNKSTTYTFNVNVVDSYKATVTTNETYRFTFRYASLLDNDNYGLNFTKSIMVTICPQKVNSIEVSHFCDVNENATTADKLAMYGMGNQSNNNIIPGEFGLLRVVVEPYYADYDYIEVISSQQSGDIISFEQFVFEGTKYIQYNGNTKPVLVQNGLRLVKKSNYISGKYDFDGIYYLRTIIASDIPVNTVFTVTVNIYKNGNIIDTCQQYISVYLLDTFTVTASHADSKGVGYFAVGTTNSYIMNISNNYTNLSCQVAGADPGKVIVNLQTKTITIDNDATLGSEYTITFSAKLNINNYIRTISRSIQIKVVDFYIENTTLSDLITNVKNGVFDVSYIKDEVYDLYLFGNIVTKTDTGGTKTITYPNNLYDSENEKFDYDFTDEQKANLSKYVSINLENATAKSNFIKFIQDINTYEQLWYSQNASIELGEKNIGSKESPKYVWSNEINGDVEIRYGKIKLYEGAEQTYNIYTLIPLRVSDDTYLQTNIYFGYNDSGDNKGEFKLYKDNTSGAIFDRTIEIQLKFDQRTSQDNPTPIYTLEEFKSMKAGKNYILMNDLLLDANWTPMTLDVASLDGNGYNLQLIYLVVNEKDSDFGVFDTIESDTLVKNLTIKIQDNQELDFNNKSHSTLNVGLFAGTNKGIITNCAVEGNKGGTTLITLSTKNLTRQEKQKHNFAGFVAVNSGNITNSHAKYICVNANGNVAGFVANNTGHIASCFANGDTNKTNTCIIKNTASNYLFGYTSTAGLVCYNTGNIYGSYVGQSWQTGSGDNYSVATDRGVQIESPLYNSGFVFSNTGIITDCYSAVTIINNSASTGFVFINDSDGTIERCYSSSTSKVSGDRTVTPFIGVNGESAKANNNSGTINNCYYYDIGFPNGALKYEVAESLGKEQFINKNGNYNDLWYGFSFSQNTGGTSTSEFTGVWVNSDDSNIYFKEKILKATGDESGNKIFGPQLVGADLISKFTQRTLRETSVDSESGEITYSYNEGALGFSITTATKTSWEMCSWEDISYNPTIITNATEFNNYVTKLHEYKYTPIIRLVNNIDLSEVASLVSTVQQLHGIIEGNGFTISNLDIGSSGTSAEQKIKKYEDYEITTENDTAVGLFKEISTTLNSNTIAAVKSLYIQVDSIKAGNINYVGTLAGVVKDACLYDIKITSEEGRILGKNVVGGVAGLVLGNSRINGIYSNVSITSTYSQNKGNEELYNQGILSSTSTNTNTLSYAGGLFGIVDLRLSGGATISMSNYNTIWCGNLTFDCEGNVVGSNVGGAIGVVGSNTIVTNAKAIYYQASSLRGSALVGGLVAQNMGIITYSNTCYENKVNAEIASAKTGAIAEKANTSIFATNNVVSCVGGLVGFNYGSTFSFGQTGIIKYCSSNLYVICSNAQNIGGLIGASLGGDLKAVYATGSVVGSVNANIGGLIGQVACKTTGTDILESGKVSNVIFKNITLNKKIEQETLCIDFVVAQNNWATAYYNYYSKLIGSTDANPTGYFGGIIGYAQKINNEIAVTTAHETGSTCEINFYNKEITAREIATSLIQKQNTSLTISNDIGNLANTDLFASGTHKENNVPKENTRGYMISVNTSTIYALWDEYSIKGYNTDGTPILKRMNIDTTIYISNAKDLVKMYWRPSQNYILTQDINADDTPFFTIGTQNQAFTGTFTSQKDHQYEISNITIKNIRTHMVGFFGYTSGANISNIKLSNLTYSTIQNANVESYVGGLVGRADNTKLDAIDINNVNITTKAYYVGGIAGSINNGSVSAELVTNIMAQNVTINYTTPLNKEQTILYVGGSFGRTDGKLTNISTSGEINLTQQQLDKVVNTLNVGGSVGEVYSGTLTKFVNDVNINSAKTKNVVQKAGLTINIDSNNQFVIGTKTFIINDKDIKLQITNEDNSITSTKVAELDINNKFMFDNITGLENWQNIEYTYNKSNQQLTYTYVIVDNKFKIDGVEYTYDYDNQKVDYGAQHSNIENNQFTISTETYTIVSIYDTYQTYHNTKIGGIVGTFNAGLETCIANGDIFVDLSNVTATESSYPTYYIGGMVGDAVNGSITNVLTANNIYLYSRDLTSGNKPTVYLGGCIGEIEDDITIDTNSYSLASIFNNSFLSVTNSFAGAKSDDQESIINSDQYYSLATNIVSSDNPSNFDTMKDLFDDTNDGFGTTNAVYNKIKESGTKINPIAITSANDFNEITYRSSTTQHTYKYYILEKDITTTLATNGAIGFYGFFNGNGKEITIDSVSTGSAYGLFGSVRESNNKPSVISGVFVDFGDSSNALDISGIGNNTNVGGIVADLGEKCIVNACGAYGSVTITSSGGQYCNVIGGVVGYNSGIINNCFNKADITISGNLGHTASDDNMYVGGIVGYTNGILSNMELSNLMNLGNITVNATETDKVYAGGIFGYAPNTNTVQMNDILSVGKIVSNEQTTKQAIGTASSVSATNVYYYTYIGTQTGYATGITYTEMREDDFDDTHNGTGLYADVFATSGLWTYYVGETNGETNTESLEYGWPVLKIMTTCTATGCGTLDSPYQIPDEQVLAYYINNDNSNRGTPYYYLLTKGINGTVTYYFDIAHTGHSGDNLISTISANDVYYYLMAPNGENTKIVFDNVSVQLFKTINTGLLYEYNTSSHVYSLVNTYDKLTIKINEDLSNYNFAVIDCVASDATLHGVTLESNDSTSICRFVDTNNGTIQYCKVNGIGKTMTKSGDNIGGIVGYKTGTLSNINVTIGSISGTGNNIGGIVGYNTGTLSDITVTIGSISGEGDYVGGIVGYNTGTLSNITVTIGSTSGTGNNIGGIVGNNTGTLSNINATIGSISGTGNNIGGIAGCWGSMNAYTRVGATTLGSDWLSATQGGSPLSPTINNIYRVLTPGDHYNKYYIWNGSTYTEYTNIVDCTLSGTNEITINVNISGKNNVGGMFGVFNGSTDNIYITTFTVGTLSISGGSNVGGFAGQVLSGGVVDATSTSCNIFTNGHSLNYSYSLSRESNSTSYSNFGGLVGYNSGTISNYTNTKSLKLLSVDYIGGIAGSNTGTITNCTNSGNITGQQNIGGIAGYNAGTITNCTNSGNITGQQNIGGIAGYNADTITNCLTGDITLTITNSSGSGTAIGNAGGIVGYNGDNTKAYIVAYIDDNTTWTSNATLCDSYNNLIQPNENTIYHVLRKKTETIQDVPTTYSEQGYYIWNSGYNNYIPSAILDSNNTITGTITIKINDTNNATAIGGFVGCNNGGTMYIDNGDYILSINGICSEVGGVVGVNNGIITIAKLGTMGSGITVTADDCTDVGGIVGNNSGTVTINASTGSGGGICPSVYINSITGNSHIGSITGTSHIGLVAGYNGATVKGPETNKSQVYYSSNDIEIVGYGNPATNVEHNKGETGGEE